MRNSVGRLIYRLNLPIIRRLLNNTRRARVLITYKDEVLLIKNWLSQEQRWQLPGGGVAKGEEPTRAACRELKEELGLAISSHQLIFLGKIAYKEPKNIEWEAHIYWLDCSKRPSIIPNTIELSEAKWHSANNLPKNRSSLVKQSFKLLAKIRSNKHA